MKRLFAIFLMGASLAILLASGAVVAETNNVADKIEHAYSAGGMDASAAAASAVPAKAEAEAPVTMVAEPERQLRAMPRSGFRNAPISPAIISTNSLDIVNPMPVP